MAAITKLILLSTLRFVTLMGQPGGQENWAQGGDMSMPGFLRIRMAYLRLPHTLGHLVTRQWIITCPTRYRCQGGCITLISRYVLAMTRAGNLRMILVLGLISVPTGDAFVPNDAM